MTLGLVCLRLVLESGTEDILMDEETAKKAIETSINGSGILHFRGLTDTADRARKDVYVPVEKIEYILIIQMY